MLPKDFDEYQAPYLEKETRFAVVMYGGVSLAIYINGVAQELYHMVRATAREIKDERRYLFGWRQLTQAEKVYRKLGDTMNTKFVVDILSGTSAGGINAVYLAKALANNQSMNEIKKMWVDEGNIGVLLNDDRSVGDIDLSLPKMRTSLLNSQRMYYKLLAALKSMDKPSQSGEPVKKSDRSPFVNELDLYITATDIRGLNMPIKIKNAVVNELRYKNVFHFRYATREAGGDPSGITLPEKEGDDFNQFAKEFDPMLAFAARCTSSFPFAFEPVQLTDIEKVLRSKDFKEYACDLNDLRSFFGEYKEGEYKTRFFGDGGYLDNKPFSYATETLLRRQADLPIDRKLIYIEPAPEHPENQKQDEMDKRPNAIENVAAALINLPRQETIREDLRLIAERNEVIRNINQVVKTAAYKIPIYVHNKQNEPEWAHSQLWCMQYLTDDAFIDFYGPGYISYNQLRVDEVISNLAVTFSRAIGWVEGSEQETRMQELFREWRKKKYSISRKDGLLSENDILFRLDLGFRMRKFTFVQSIVNTLILNVDALIDIDHGAGDKIPDVIHNLFDANGISFAVKREEKEDFILKLRDIKEKINEVHAYMRACGRTLRSRGLTSGKDTPEELKEYVAVLEKIKKMMENKDFSQAVDLIEEATCTLSAHFQPDKTAPRPPVQYLHQVMDNVSIRANEIVGMNHWRKVNPADALTLDDKIYKSLSSFYDNFEYYDMLVYPIQYGTNVGESDIVEVVRVSPEEASGVRDEKKKKKLAGTKVLNFSAFFSQGWRENDILWGRLDAAEIMIDEILTTDCDNKNDERYIKRAARLKDELRFDPSLPDYEPCDIALNAILREDFGPKLDNAISKIAVSDENGWLAQAQTRLKFLNLGLKKGKIASERSTLQKISAGFEVLTQNGNLLDFFKKNYDVNRDFPDDTFKVASRSTQVLIKMVENLAVDYPVLDGLKRPIRNVLLIASWFLLIAKKVSFADGLAALLYVSSGILVLSGFLLPGFKDALLVGLLVFALTVSSHISALKIHNGMAGANVEAKAGKVASNIISFIWMILMIVFWVVVAALVYIGMLSLNIPIPENIIGSWLKIFMEVFKTW